MSTPEVGDVLLVSPSLRRRLPTLGSIAAFLCAYVFLGVLGVIPRWMLWLGVAVFGLVLVVGLFAALKARTTPWELRLDPDGVTVRGHSVRPWSDFAEVRVTGLRPDWLFVLSSGRVVSFVGRPGVELPALPSAKLPGVVGRRSALIRTRWYGTQLIVMPYAFDASTELILDAVRRFSDVPVCAA